MGGRRIGAMMILLAACAGPVQAGIHNPAEAEEAPLDFDFDRFGQTLSQLRMIAWPKVPKQYPLRTRHLLAVQLKSVPSEKWTPSERLSLSAYLIRTGDARRAQEILGPLVRDGHFLALSNLAVSYYPERMVDAFESMRLAVKAWPSWNELSKEQAELVKQLGWDEPRFADVKRAETYYLKLLDLRRREPPRRAVDQEKVDALFDEAKKPLRFVGESGQFEPGKLAASEKKKLPGNNVHEAIRIVQQLLVWMPNDARLLWQLAELYNAAGERVGAHKVYQALRGIGSSFNYGPDELKAHQQALAADLKQNPPKEKAMPGEEKLDAPPADEESDPPLVEWRTLTVGFAAGMIVMLLISWQWQETRRRRQRRLLFRSGHDDERASALSRRVHAGESPAPSAPETHIRADEPRRGG